MKASPGNVEFVQILIHRSRLGLQWELNFYICKNREKSFNMFSKTEATKGAQFVTKEHVDISLTSFKQSLLC